MAPYSQTPEFIEFSKEVEKVFILAEKAGEEKQRRILVGLTAETFERTNVVASLSRLLSLHYLCKTSEQAS